MEARFYHITASAAKNVLYSLICQAYGRGSERILVYCPDANSCAALSDLLWSRTAESFIAHITEKEWQLYKNDDFFVSHQRLLLASQLIDDFAAEFCLCWGCSFVPQKTYQKIAFIFAGYEREDKKLAKQAYEHFSRQAYNFLYYKQLEKKWQLIERDEFLADLTK